MISVDKYDQSIDLVGCHGISGIYWDLSWDFLWDFPREKLVCFSLGDSCGLMAGTLGDLRQGVGLPVGSSITLDTLDTLGITGIVDIHHV